MGYRLGTKVKCTKPELLISGSTFYNEWEDFLFEVKDGVTEYCCQKNYLNDALAELSRNNPEVTFSGCIWIDDDFENARDFTFILKNGIYDYIDMAPHYQILFPVIEDDEYNSLKDRFVRQLEIYLKRIDVIRKDAEEEVVFDFLNDKEGQDGFVSYYTITWENDIHRFTATKRYTSQVIVDYQRKSPYKKEETKIEENHTYDNQDDMYDNLPF